MSNYAVNCSIPKTLVRHLVAYLARDNAEKDEASMTCWRIFWTPLSPRSCCPLSKGDQPADRGSGGAL